MKDNSTTISCDVCQDLIPLVLDGVASEDSRTLVQNHIRNCEVCRSICNADVLAKGVPTIENDLIIIKRIKRATHLTLFVVILIGGLFGITLSNQQEVFYNSIIMPLVGALSYVILKKRSLFICLSFTSAAYLWMLLSSWIEDGFGSAIFVHPIFFTVIYLILMGIGVLIAALLSYAFRKEDMTKTK